MEEKGICAKALDDGTWKNFGGTNIHRRRVKRRTLYTWERVSADTTFGGCRDTGLGDDLATSGGTGQVATVSEYLANGSA